MIGFNSSRISKGFTLVELIFVLVIAAIVAGFLIPKLSSTSDAAKVSANEHNIAVINRQVERWYLENDAWPEDDLSDIGADLNYFPEGLPVNPVDGSSYELDPNTHRVLLPAAP